MWDEDFDNDFDDDFDDDYDDDDFGATIPRLAGDEYDYPLTNENMDGEDF